MADGSPLAHSPTLASSPPRGHDDEDELAPGTAVGEYVVERFLGAGAMGEVYAGKQPVIGKKVAIKVLKREVAASADGAERFTREARAVNQVDHPGVIDIFSFGRMADGRLYLVMDLVEGKSLRKALIDGPLAPEAALDVLAQIADALDAAHARGVIHRDLKPDNVMLAPGEPPKVYVLDFGLAKLLSTEGASAKASMLTGQGTWLGTPGYMAPEQWSADGAGPASDRYALGVIGFELLSGSLPFKADSLPQMMEQHFRAKVPALSSRGALPASAAFDPVVSRAMAKDPDARFATAREMVEALRAVHAGKRAPAAAAPTRLWVPAAAGAGVLGMSIAAVLALQGGEDDPPRREPELAPSAAPAGTAPFELLTAPPGAEVRRGGKLLGTTPIALDVAPSERFHVELRKPGYETITTEVSGKRAPFSSAYGLTEIAGFEGVWTLPGGQLRAFRRTGDRVAINKLDTVDGAQTFFRHLDFVAAETGVTFATSEEVIDPRAPNEPSCHIPHRVEYHYEPATDAFELRRERVVVDLVGGSCVKRSAALDPPIKLARADRRSETERVTLPPVGKPVFEKKKPAKSAPVKSATNAKNAKQKAFEAVQNADTPSGPQPQAANPPPSLPPAQKTDDSQVSPPVPQQQMKKN
ncbi:MAG TPA: serine/threonine-protein kinase [Kofleriaceae bacterium]|nr:serine/threonine-protein kinase [Kofleriaceae bacterium]